MATLELATIIENKLAERDKQGNPKHSLADLLAEEPAKQRFASLGGMVTKTMAIPESGVW